MIQRLARSVAGLALAAMLSVGAAPAAGQTTPLVFDGALDRCDLQLARRAMSYNLEVPVILDDVTEAFCRCGVVTEDMLAYLRRHEYFLHILVESSQQCPRFAQVLANGATASTGGGGSGAIGGSGGGGSGIGSSGGGSGRGGSGGGGGGSPGDHDDDDDDRYDDDDDDDRDDDDKDDDDDDDDKRRDRKSKKD